MAKELKRGWVPSDEGTLALSAEHVLQGEVPHCDYQEGYTGGLSYLNAAAFRIFGTNLATLRYVMFVFFLAWIPAHFYAASKFVSPSMASVTTLVAVAWGPPNYAAAMPSWYNLFFATFGFAALLRYIENNHKRWLVVAGFCGGLSILFKIAGLFFVAATLLFLLFREQVRREADFPGKSETCQYSIVLILFVLSFEVAVFEVLRQFANIATYFYFLLPNLALGAAIVWQEFHAALDRSKRFRFLSTELVWFSAGVALPVVTFLLPYLLNGCTLLFIHDLVDLPQRLISHSNAKPAVFVFFMGALVDLIFIAGVFFSSRTTVQQPWQLTLLGVSSVLFVAAALLVASRSEIVYTLIWNCIWAIAPIIVLLGISLLISGFSSGPGESVRKQQLFLSLCITGTCGLIQFPFTSPTYFCYVAPLVLLTVTAVMSFVARPPRLALAGAILFCTFFALFEMTPGFIYDLGHKYSPNIQEVQLNLARGGGLRVSAETADEYQKLGYLIRQHVRGDYILATPDCPEVYFLFGFRNPTRVFFDFYDDDRERTQRTLATIQLHKINLVVLNRHPAFSPITEDLVLALEREFPNRAEVGDFEVRWKS